MARASDLDFDSKKSNVLQITKPDTCRMWSEGLPYATCKEFVSTDHV